MNKSENISAAVLDKSFKGESGVLYTMFSAREGVFNCLKKIGVKSFGTLPDFFDEVSIDAEFIGQSDLRIMRDFEIIKGRGAMSKNYDAFLHAGEMCRCLIKNGKYLESPAPVHGAFQAALDAMAQGARPALTRFKFMYVFAKGEGYALKQDFAKTLPVNLRAALREALTKPAQDCIMTQAEEAALLKNLLVWLAENTDFAS